MGRNVQRNVILTTNLHRTSFIIKTEGIEQYNTTTIPAILPYFRGMFD
jgi:hypothetical protein